MADDHGKKGGDSKTSPWPVAVVVIAISYFALYQCTQVVGGHHLVSPPRNLEFRGLADPRPAAPNPPVQTAVPGPWRCEMPTPKNEGGQRFYVAFGRRMDMTTPRPTSTSRLCIDGVGAKWEENIKR